jgi:hypothetical protein
MRCYIKDKAAHPCGAGYHSRIRVPEKEYALIFFQEILPKRPGFNSLSLSWLSMLPHLFFDMSVGLSRNDSVERWHDGGPAAPSDGHCPMQPTGCHVNECRRGGARRPPFGEQFHPVLNIIIICNTNDNYKTFNLIVPAKHGSRIPISTFGGHNSSICGSPGTSPNRRIWEFSRRPPQLICPVVITWIKPGVCQVQRNVAP